MIPCYVCGKDASTGWVQGFVPAPDSQKLALCAEHNTFENRLLVGRAWREMNEREIASMTSVARHKAAPSLQVASVHFTGGGMLSFTCTACGPTGQGTLRIDQADGTHTFIPLQHIREYAIRPYAAGAPEEKPGIDRRGSFAELLPPAEGNAPDVEGASAPEHEQAERNEGETPEKDSAQNTVAVPEQ